MATPLVAGAALLVRDYFVRGFYSTGQAVANNRFDPSSSLVKAVLINGAVEVAGVRSDWNSEGKFPNNAGSPATPELSRCGTTRPRSAPGELGPARTTSAVAPRT